MRFRASSTFSSLLTHLLEDGRQEYDKPPTWGGSVFTIPGHTQSKMCYLRQRIPKFLASFSNPAPHREPHFPWNTTIFNTQETIISRAKSAPSAHRGRRGFTKDSNRKMHPQTFSSSVWATAACLLDRFIH